MATLTAFVPNSKIKSAEVNANFTGLNTETTALLSTGIGIVLDGGGSVLTTGVKLDLQIPYSCTITQVDALADQSGSIVVDIWKDSYANYPPTDADSITASAPVTITATVKSSDATLTGWTTSITAGDTLRFNIDSVSTVQRLEILLYVTRTT